MSRGFVKEDDQEEAPFIPPRAALPDGVDNWVTEEGLEALKVERAELLEQRRAADSLVPNEKRRTQTVIDAQLQALDERIDRAQVHQPVQNPQVVQFAQRVTYRELGAKTAFELKIVGVDEADLKASKVSFLAPVIQAMMGKPIGTEVKLSLGGTDRTFVIEAIR